MGFKIKSIKKALRKVHHVRQRLGLTGKRFNNLFGRDHGASSFQSIQPTSAATQSRRLSNLVRSF